MAASITVLPQPKTHMFKFQDVLLYFRDRPDMPMKIEDLLKAKRQEILAIAARHGAHNLRVFGSVARGEAGPESDLDILVEMEPGKSLLDHVALMQDLEDLLQRKVDVVSERALHWYIRDKVLAEAMPL
jgi:predicted nucleotidyltransferase